MTLTLGSVRSVGFGVLIEQISCGANFMLIGPQENVSLTCFYKSHTNLLSQCHRQLIDNIDVRSDEKACHYAAIMDCNLHSYLYISP